MAHHRQTVFRWHEVVEIEVHCRPHVLALDSFGRNLRIIDGIIPPARNNPYEAAIFRVEELIRARDDRARRQRLGGLHPHPTCGRAVINAQWRQDHLRDHHREGRVEITVEFSDLRAQRARVRASFIAAARLCKGTGTAHTCSMVKPSARSRTSVTGNAVSRK